MAGGGKNTGRPGGSGHASNAALQDDEDLMARRGKRFRTWAAEKRKSKSRRSSLIDYVNSPSPPRRG
jgi:hypothetical protein